MTSTALATLGRGVLQAALALLLAPLAEGLLRQLKALVHSRQGPPLRQPYRDLLKLLGKEDLRTATGLLYGATPALALASALLTALLAPIGGPPPLSFAGDFVVLLYAATMSAVMVMLAGFGSGSPYAAIGSSREMLLLLSVEPVLAIAFVVGAVKSGTLTLDGIVAWHAAHGPALSMLIAGGAFFLALQAQAAKLPFDIAEAEQEIMGGSLIEQSGPRLALFRWALWVKQLVFALVLVEVFFPWPRVGGAALSLLLALGKAAVALLLVGLLDATNPRLRIEQAMGYFLRVGLVAVAALAFAVIGI